MRFLALAFFFGATVSYCEAETMKELINIANKAGAPFTKVALERMNNTELWGAKNASTSADIVIINASGTSFNPFVPVCSFGSFSPGLLPENNLYGHTSSVLGVQSSVGDEYAYINCYLEYLHAESSTFFTIALDSTKTLRGDVFAEINCSPNIEITKVVGKGKNNQMRFKVSDISVGLFN